MFARAVLGASLLLVSLGSSGAAELRMLGIVEEPGGSLRVVARYEASPEPLWLGVSWERPDGTVQDLSPLRVSGVGEARFALPSMRCSATSGHRIAVALWRGFDPVGGRMIDPPVHRFHEVVWLPLSCGEYQSARLPGAEGADPASTSARQRVLRGYARLFHADAWLAAAQAQHEAVLQDWTDLPESPGDLVAWLAREALASRVPAAGELHAWGAALSSLGREAIAWKAQSYAFLLVNMDGLARGRSVPTISAELLSAIGRADLDVQSMGRVRSRSCLYSEMLARPDRFESSTPVRAGNPFWSDVLESSTPPTVRKNLRSAFETLAAYIGEPCQL